MDPFTASALTLSGVSAEDTIFKDRTSVLVTMPSSSYQNPQTDTLTDRPLFAWIPLDFANGSIQVDVASVLAADAPAFANHAREQHSQPSAYREGSTEATELDLIRVLNDIDTTRSLMPTSLRQVFRTRAVRSRASCCSGQLPCDTDNAIPRLRDSRGTHARRNRSDYIPDAQWLAGSGANARWADKAIHGRRVVPIH